MHSFQFHDFPILQLPDFKWFLLPSLMRAPRPWLTALTLNKVLKKLLFIVTSLGMSDSLLNPGQPNASSFTAWAFVRDTRSQAWWRFVSLCALQVTCTTAWEGSLKVVLVKQWKSISSMFSKCKGLEWTLVYFFNSFNLFLIKYIFILLEILSSVHCLLSFSLNSIVERWLGNVGGKPDIVFDS